MNLGCARPCLSQFMKIAVVGGTHGNEPVGIEVIRHLDRKPPTNPKNEFDTFWANPGAYEAQRRFVDCDLNRTFGKNGHSCQKYD